MTYMRLVLMHARDAIAHQQIERELCFINHHVTSQEGYERSAVLSQDNGLLIGLLTIWTAREHAEGFAESGLNNLLPAVTKLRITGTPVTRLFRIIG